MASSTALGEMTLVEHLAELRQRLVRCVLGLLAGTIVGYLVYDRVFAFLIDPYCAIPDAYRAIGPEGTTRCTLVSLAPLEPFSVRLKVSMLVGLFIAAPIIFYQLWRFVTPGLTRRERRYGMPFVVGSQVMFVTGGAFAFLVIPKGLPILLGFGGDLITPQISAAAYLSFIITMIVAFGVVFELPLLITFLALIGVVGSRGLRRFRPYAVLGNVVIAAVVTPTGDPLTLFGLAGPMILFYEASILAARWIERSRARRSQGELV